MMKKEYPLRKLGKKLFLLTVLLVTLCVSVFAEENSYLAFQSEDGKSFTLEMSAQQATWKTDDGAVGTMEYATSVPNEDSSWTSWDGKTITAPNGTLYLRGTGNSTITAYQNNTKTQYARFVFGGEATKIACTGSIMTLLDYKATKMPPMGERCFQTLFQNCSKLTKAPELPATTLSNYCYLEMFSGCSALTTAPKLPATTLSNYCYLEMFSGCSALTTAPELPATTLFPACYAGMFQDCVALTRTPDLKATDLKQGCYRYMFKGCTSLVIVSDLSIQKLSKESCKEMFAGCASLDITTTPEAGESYRTWEISAKNGGENWNTSMVDGTGIELGNTYYIKDSHPYSISFADCKMDTIGEQCIQICFDGEVMSGVTVLTTQKTVQELFNDALGQGKWEELDGRIRFGLTLVGVPKDIHVTEAKFVTVS